MSANEPRTRIHKALMLTGKRFGVMATIVTTLCGRMRDDVPGDKGYNSTNQDSAVTCKLCLRRMKAKEANHGG